MALPTSVGFDFFVLNHRPYSSPTFSPSPQPNPGRNHARCLVLPPICVPTECMRMAVMMMMSMVFITSILYFVYRTMRFPSP